MEAAGAFTLYDDAGDGFGKGRRIPLRYEEAAGELTLGAGGICTNLSLT